MRFRHPERVAQWPSPNYVDPESRGPAMFINNSIIFSLATTAVIARTYVRLFVRRWFGWDDLLLIIGWVSLSCLAFLYTTAYAGLEAESIFPSLALFCWRFSCRVLGVYPLWLEPSYVGCAARTLQV